MYIYFSTPTISATHLLIFCNSSRSFVIYADCLDRLYLAPFLNHPACEVPDHKRAAYVPHLFHPRKKKVPTALKPPIRTQEIGPHVPLPHQTTPYPLSLLQIRELH